MKSLQLLWKVLAQECASIVCTCAAMDCKTVDRRIEHEGLSFLTITLPDFGKDLQKALDQGQVDRRLFTSFRRRGELPLFLGGFLDLVFDRTDGRLLNNPDVQAIWCLRQLTLSFAKLELPCSPARERKAMSDFVQCEQDIRVADMQRSSVDSERFAAMSSLLYGSVFTKVDSDIYHGKIIPRHGPGTTADRLLGNQKFRQREWTERLQEVFCFSEFLFVSASYYDKYDEVDILEPGAERPVQVLSVPKTLKTPRIIAREPTAMQYVQQGVSRSLVRHLKEDDFLSRVIGFDDQTPNQRLAHDGSLYGDLATLDLSEASDRVSNQLVRAMLRHHPYLLKGVDACRSRRADVPGHGVLRLAKFASMGSALTFPIEAIVFLTIIFLGIEESLNRPLTRKDIYSFRDRVRVFGDDIIVPKDHVQSVVKALETFGSRVNQGKSFWNGSFRESCGKEYYAGFDVSIVKVRKMLPTQRTDATEISATVSLRNRLYWAGLWQTARWLDERLVRILKKYPMVSPTSPVLGRESVLGYEIQGYTNDTHAPFVRGWRDASKSPSNIVDGHDALLKCLLKNGEEPFIDPDHLVRSGRPQSVKLKLGMGSPF